MESFTFLRGKEIDFLEDEKIPKRKASHGVLLEELDSSGDMVISVLMLNAISSKDGVVVVNCFLRS